VTRGSDATEPTGPTAPSAPTVLLTGGGTGGHVNPALAVAEALRDRGVRVVFVGTAAGLEARLVPAAGFALRTVPARPLRGQGAAARAGAATDVVRAAGQVARLARAEHARAALTFGGYTAGPLAAGARLSRTPLVVHEQNAVPGLANRLAARWATAVAVSMPGIAERFPRPSRVVLTGNPIRGDLTEGRLPDRTPAAVRLGLDPRRRTLLVFGGSQGARRLNDAVLAATDSWPDPAGLQVLHAAGERDADRVEAAWRSRDRRGLHVVTHRYLASMADAYAAADVVVCRAGASTVAELTAVGLPAVLVPYPHAAADEQTANARAIAEAGGAVHVADDALDGQRLVAEVAPLLADPQRRAAMRAAARELGRPDAAAAVAELVLAAGGLADQHAAEVSP